MIEITFATPVPLSLLRRHRAVWFNVLDRILSVHRLDTLEQLQLLVGQRRRKPVQDAAVVLMYLTAVGFDFLGVAGDVIFRYVVVEHDNVFIHAVYSNATSKFVMERSALTCSQPCPGGVRSST